MNTFQMYFYHFKQKLANALVEQQQRNNIKQHGYDPLHLVTKYNVAIEDAGRYRWLRDSGHLDMFWSVEGPEDRCDNIDADIEDAMAEDAVTVLMASHNKSHADSL